MKIQTDCTQSWTYKISIGTEEVHYEERTILYRQGVICPTNRLHI